jgi:hypothetical protein
MNGRLVIDERHVCRGWQTCHRRDCVPLAGRKEQGDVDGQRQDFRSKFRSIACLTTYPRKLSLPLLSSTPEPPRTVRVPFLQRSAIVFTVYFHIVSVQAIGIARRLHFRAVHTNTPLLRATHIQ